MDICPYDPKQNTDRYRTRQIGRTPNALATIPIEFLQRELYINQK
jgi:hypothetical protein